MANVIRMQIVRILMDQGHVCANQGSKGTAYHVMVSNKLPKVKLIHTERFIVIVSLFTQGMANLHATVSEKYQKYDTLFLFETVNVCIRMACIRTTKRK